MQTSKTLKTKKASQAEVYMKKNYLEPPVFPTKVLKWISNGDLFHPYFFRDRYD